MCTTYTPQRPDKYWPLDMEWWTVVLHFTVPCAAQMLLCDQQTQYKSQDGRCCKKCGPGTRMHTTGINCLDPLCIQCTEDEYQSGYTVHTRCDLQPYCDPNKNFVDDGPQSTERRVECVCKDGYHCSSQACTTCVEHSNCAPGQRVQDKGNHGHDTVCQDCPPKTFSTEEPADGDCQNWTVCEAGSQTKLEGTTTSDTICEKLPRSHIGVIPPVIVIIVVILALIAWWKCRGNATTVQGSATSFDELHVDETSNKNGLLICQPQEEQMLTIFAEENDHFENDDHIAMTEQGNMVTHDYPLSL